MIHVICDNAGFHKAEKSKVVKAYLEEWGHRVVLHYLPTYSPDTNPVERVAEAMAAAPDRRMTVLCGHTHGGGESQILPNLRVLTGGARYGRPEVQRVLTIQDALVS